MQPGGRSWMRLVCGCKGREGIVNIRYPHMSRLYSMGAWRRRRSRPGRVVSEVDIITPVWMQSSRAMTPDSMICSLQGRCWLANGHIRGVGNVRGANLFLIVTVVLGHADRDL
jgi:hypothetical protein